MKIIFATANPHKVSEVRAVLKDTKIEVMSLSEIGFLEEIEESGATLEANALIKAQTIYERFGVDVFGEDTGLEIEALNGRPGVRTARYAGPDKDPVQNMAKVLRELEGLARRARFRSSLSLILNGITHTFEGIVNGQIADTPRGTGGFGYDPIFIPDGYDETFAELPDDVKEGISHRAVAVQRLVDFLRSRVAD